MKTQDTQTNGRGDSAAQHTPGPWKSQGFRVIRADKMEAWQLVVADVPVATGEPFDDNADAAARNVDQQRANTKLIAAAPALLEALRDCVTLPGALAERSHEYALRRLQRITETALEAIAQATGQAD